ncbi:MAG: lysophospholipid acyltransferase family protein, partial [Syntrophales bacterium]|nr:lysophospholipid acyltransferase family protein [Syntrophales bacterium]
IIILYFFKAIPLPLRKWFFKSLFTLFYYLISRQRLIALHNLHRAFPEKPIADIIGIAQGVYRHMAIVTAEFFELPWLTKENLYKWVDVEGLEYFWHAKELGKGALTIVAHFGNWEMMPVVFPLVAEPACIIYRPLDNPILNNLITWVRSRNGNMLIAKEGSGRPIIRLLQKNKIFGILSDQNVSVHEGVFVNFFGRPACTGLGLAVLAMRSGAPVIPAFMPRMADGRYKMIFMPPVAVDCTDDYEKDLLTNTQRFTGVIERVVRQYPDQWFWLHQRWKTKTCQKD